MIINTNDYREVINSLTLMQGEGYHYVAFINGEPNNESSLSYFKTSWEAAEYTYEMATDLDTYGSLPLAAVLAAMENHTFGARQAVVDIGTLVRERTTGTIQLNNPINYKIMNEKNFEYLKDQIKYTGFGEGMENELRENMQKQNPEFTLNHSATYGTDSARATLTFRKSEQSEMYFFNSYRVGLTKENSKENLEQTFYINKGSNITLKEAYNLMEGRSVNKDLTPKEGPVYNAWVQLDFKDTDPNGNFRLSHYHQNYGYDLEAAVSKHPIKELQTPKFRDDLLESLRKGNRQSATFLKDGIEVKQYIEANPQFKTITIYDENMQRIGQRQPADEKQSQAQQQTDKKEARQTQDSGDGEAGGPAKETNRKRKNQSNSL